MPKRLVNWLQRVWTGSIRRQLVLGIMLVHALLMTLFVLDLVHRQRAFLLEQSRAQASSLADALAANSLSWILADDVIGLEEVLSAQSNYPDLKYAMVLSPEGQVLGHTNPDLSGFYLSDTKSRQLLQAPHEGTIVHQSARLIDLAAPIFSNDQFIGWARVALGRDQILDGLQIITRNGVIYILLAILIGLLFALLMARGLTLGLRHLVEIASQVGGGAAEARSQLKRADELGQLSDDFNRMLDNLERSHRELNTALEQQRRQEQDLRITLDSLADGVIATDIEQRITRMNPVAAHLTGWDQDEALGQPLASIYQTQSIADQQPLHDPVRRMLANGTPYHPLRDQVSLRARAGGIRQVAQTTAPITDRGQLCGAVLVFHDISEELRVQRELTESQLRYRKVFEDNHTIKLIFAADDGHIIDCNQAAAEFYGYTSVELRQMQQQKLLAPPEDSEPASQAQDQNPLIHSHVQTRHRLANGELRDVEIYSCPIHDRDGEQIYSIIIDVTARRRAEDIARHAQKLEAVGNLTGGIAHDFNNILAIASGNLEMLEWEGRTSSKADLRIAAITTALDRAAQLTRQLLGFARRTSATRVPVDLNPLIRGLNQLLDRALTPSIQLELQLETSLWSTAIDPGDLRDVLVNLSLNARDAMEGAGQLTIETHNTQLDQGFCSRHQEVPPGDYVELVVSDNGCGMSPALVDRIFEPFFTTKELGKGTGLGLAMVFGFAQRSGGFILVYSEPGMGTSFRLLLPRYRGEGMERDPTTDSNDQETADSAMRGGRETILVVDDEPELVTLASNTLSPLGYRILEAHNGEEALALLAEQSVDLVFSDVVMPGPLSGYDLGERAQLLYPGIRVLLTSGHTARMLERRDPDHSKFEILSKPYARPVLVRKVRRLLDQPST